MRCRICEADVRRLRPTVRGPEGSMAAYVCGVCGHVQTAMCLPAAVIEAQYSGAGYGQAYARQSGLSALEARAAVHAEYFLRAVRKHSAPGVDTNVCDVGTGEGWFLHALSPDFDCYGVELCRASAQLAEQGVGSGRVRQSLDEFDRLFDAVTFFDVLEHLAEPRRLARMAADKLRPGGLFVCVNPGRNLWDEFAVTPYNPFAGTFLRRRLSMAHVSVFSAQSLRLLLERSGLIVHEVKRFTDIGETFSIADGWRGRLAGSVVRALAGAGMAPRNRLMAVASRPVH